eukprot:CAMPEP_0119301886 /NCGR_PEP_ID=MMETSP1333-20130426/3595_1 /TAXON_ID=418940 /ORGANISM="Scyphosphaera apsteinii, Strain RCC1455" /LENGTH=331 /DNA_ID=CAMNT_0007304093 /DNA_START=401 /DNA_END=1396 /DNA_ORIENTATION=+
MHGRDCTYIDVGCSLGYFAAQAVALGARAICYEPTPVYVDAIQHSRKLNRASDESWMVHQAAVFPQKRKSSHRMSDAYKPCGVGRNALRAARGQSPRGWNVPVISMDEVLRGRNVTVLKVDTDGDDGALLASVEAILAARETSVETIVVELGDLHGLDAWCLANPSNYIRGRPKSEDVTKAACAHLSTYMRGAPFDVLWRFVHVHGYDAYRLNTHTAREIFDWRGINLNKRMAPAPYGLQPFFGVRGMRKLERLDPQFPLTKYPELLRWGQSFLLTRVSILPIASHHELDVFSMQRAMGTHRTWHHFQGFLNNGTFADRGLPADFNSSVYE